MFYLNIINNDIKNEKLINNIIIIISANNGVLYLF